MHFGSGGYHSQASPSASWPATRDYTIMPGHGAPSSRAPNSSKVAAEFGAREEGAHVQGVDGVVPEAGGTSPATMRWARPSVMAVFPTPASPTWMGLFLSLRHNTCTVRSISAVRPMTGSSLPSCWPTSARSEANRSRGFILPAARGLRSSRSSRPSSSSSSSSSKGSPSGHRSRYYRFY